MGTILFFAWAHFKSIKFYRFDIEPLEEIEMCLLDVPSTCLTYKCMMMIISIDWLMHVYILWLTYRIGDDIDIEWLGVVCVWIRRGFN